MKFSRLIPLTFIAFFFASSVFFLNKHWFIKIEPGQTWINSNRTQVDPFDSLGTTYHVIDVKEDYVIYYIDSARSDTMYMRKRYFVHGVEKVE